MNVQTRAMLVARIFDIIAWVVIAATVLGMLGFIGVGLFGDNGFSGFVVAVVIAALVAVYGAITWAGITLATVVAGYIASRSHAE